MNYLKIISIWLIIIFILLFPLEFASYYFIKKQLDHGVQGAHVNKEQFELYAKYTFKLHHLRDIRNWSKTTNISMNNNFLFTEMSKVNTSNDKKGNLILFQGDSWAELFVKYKSSRKIFENYLKKNNLSGVHAGISSYSPSLLTLQLRILRQDFDFRPKNLIKFLDGQIVSV